MNNIPDGWKKYRLEEIAEIYNGNSINKTVKAEKYTGLKEGYNFIGTKDVGFDGIVNYENGVKIPFGESKFKIAPGDCVFVCSEGGSAGKKTAYITQKVCFGNKLFAIVPKTKDCSSKYIYYFTRSNNFFDQFKSLLAGIIGGVSNKNFGKINLPLPSISEQQRIVTKIEELFSKLDAGIESLKKAKKQLAVYRQAVLKEAFVQKESKIVTLAEITDEIKIGPFGTMLHKEDYISDGIPVINPQHIKNGQIIPSSKISISSKKCQELASYKVKTNDVIMGRRGEMGRCAAITKKEDGWLCGTGSILFRLKSDFDACVYAKILSSPDIVHYLEKNATGTTMKNLNEEIVKNIPVPFITKQEQSSIVRNIESRLSVCDKIERTVNESLEKADVLRQSILKKAFEGGL